MFSRSAILPFRLSRRLLSSTIVSIHDLIRNESLFEKILTKCRPKTRRSLISVTRDMRDLMELKKQNESDPEIEAEVMSMEKELENLMSAIREDLVMSDEDNQVDQLILEVMAGVGGQEAMLFADELAQMYQTFASTRGWNFSLINRNESEMGGIRALAAQIEGTSCFKFMRNEAGVHRVQRVPKTEKSGRVHTSTAAVAVIPVLETAEQQILPKDISIVTSRSSGAGGQHVNKTESCIHLTHLPTGIQVECQEERHQLANKLKAMQKLQQILILRQKEKILAEYETRKSVQVSNMSRSEKIRTYNFPQDRITDHRLSENLHDIRSFMRGDGDRLLNLMQKLNHESEGEYVRRLIKSLSLYSRSLVRDVDFAGFDFEDQVVRIDSVHRASH